MKDTASKASHVVKGDILDELGFSPTEASSLKVKADLLDAILRVIRRRGYTQSQLVGILDEYQPSVSNLLNGQIASVSIEKLIRYADRLGLCTSLTIGPNRGFRGNRRRSERRAAPRKSRQVA